MISGDTLGTVQIYSQSLFVLSGHSAVQKCDRGLWAKLDISLIKWFIDGDVILNNPSVVFFSLLPNVGEHTCLTSTGLGLESFYTLGGTDWVGWGCGVKINAFSLVPVTDEIVNWLNRARKRLQPWAVSLELYCTLTSCYSGNCFAQT